MLILPGYYKLREKSSEKKPTKRDHEKEEKILLKKFIFIIIIYPILCEKINNEGEDDEN